MDVGHEFALRFWVRVTYIVTKPNSRASGSLHSSARGLNVLVKGLAAVLRPFPFGQKLCVTYTARMDSDRKLAAEAPVTDVKLCGFDKLGVLRRSEGK